MPAYSFRYNTKLYIVAAGLQYRIDVYPDLTFSQTFDERQINVKTLHVQTDMFEQAVITKANPGNFSFTTPIRTDNTQKIIMDLLLDYDSTTLEKVVRTADIYVDTGEEVYKLEKCVFEQGTFNISKYEITTVSISGTLKKLSRVGVSGVYSIPGTPQTYTDTQAYIIPNASDISIDEVTQDFVTSISLEISNNINWVPYNHLHSSLAVQAHGDEAFPGDFVVSNRTVSGTVVEYLNDENNSDTNTWKIGEPLRIRVGNSSSAYVLDFNLPEVVYTNRLAVGDIFMQSYDFRLINSPASLSSIIKIGV